MTHSCTNFCEHCGDCLDCYAEDVCFDNGVPHSWKVGDQIKIGNLTTKIDGFVNDFGNKMIATEYGNFAVDICENIQS